MIALPLSYLSSEAQKIAKTTAEMASMYIDNEARIGMIAGGEDSEWVYVWFVEADLDDSDACNKEFQDKLEGYIEQVKDF